MNALSLFIYFAEVSGNLGSFLSIVGWIGLISALVAGIIGFVIWGESDGKGPWKGFVQYAKVAVVAGLITVTVSMFIPSRDTIYMIAGSEASEAVATSATGQEILGNLEAILKAKVKEMVPDGD